MYICYILYSKIGNKKISITGALHNIWIFFPLLLLTYLIIYGLYLTKWNGLLQLHLFFLVHKYYIEFLFHNFNKNKTIKILYNYMTNWPSVTIITLLCWLVTYPKSGQLTTCWIDPENNFHIITTVCFCTAEIRCTFSSNHNIHKSLCGLCFWSPDPLINRFL